MSAAPELADREVAITGKLASMSREEAVRRLREAGARYAPFPGPETAYLAVGQGGPPLSADGRPTRSLLAARELAARGTGLRIVQEEEWLGLLGLAERSADVHRRYTATQLARILGVTRAELRAWVRRGLVTPEHTVGRLALFDFHQVAVARGLAELVGAGVAPSAIARSLRELQGWLGEEGAPLGALEALDESGELVVRLDDGSLAEPTGQLRLAFDGAPAPGPAPVRLPRPARHASPWFERALVAEEAGRPEEAVQAYRRAIGEDGPTAEACFNLGNALYALGRRADAADAFAQATEVEPDHVEAWNNLGNVLSELARGEEAVRAYRRALAVEPTYADAHYNLGVTLAALGDPSGARRHFLCYLREDPHSPWADEVHDRLARLE